MNNQDPLDDPLLDAFEQSIENPPGFADPLAKNDDLFLDGLAKQLGKVEDSIENASPIAPTPDVIDDDFGSDDEFGLTDTSEEVDDPEDDDDEKDKSPNWQLPNIQDSLTGPTILSPQISKKDGTNRDKTGSPSRRHGSRARGCTNASISRNTRLCPESHELIGERSCESCEKYRHWPEGTDEEPKECWYDWEDRQSFDECEDDGELEG